MCPPELTLDHVEPRSRGGESSWIIWWRAAGVQSSQGQPDAGRAGMKLSRRPRGFSMHVIRQIMRYLAERRNVRKYLFMSRTRGNDTAPLQP